jgi:arginine repressor
MEAETAGDPMTGLKWTRRTTAKIAVELKSFGIDVSSKTVARLLKQLGFSLRVNQKKVARTVNVSPKERDAQFSHIAELRELCAAGHVPVISVDTKKKELIGNLKMPVKPGVVTV